MRDSASQAGRRPVHRTCGWPPVVHRAGEAVAAWRRSVQSGCMDTALLEKARDRWRRVVTEVDRLRAEARSLESVEWESTSAAKYRERLQAELRKLDDLEQRGHALLGAYQEHIAAIAAVPDPHHHAMPRIGL